MNIYIYIYICIIYIIIQPDLADVAASGQSEPSLPLPFLWGYTTVFLFIWGGGTHASLLT